MGTGRLALRRIDFDFDFDDQPPTCFQNGSPPPPPPPTPPTSFGRGCEDALNRQIAREYELSIFYHSLACRYGNRSLYLPGLAKMFLEESDEERRHAQSIMDYVNFRGGNVRLRCLRAPSDPDLAASPRPSPPTGGEEKERGGNEFTDALNALRASYEAERDNLSAIRSLYDIAQEEGDVPLSDWISENLLREQIGSVTRQFEILSRLRRLGPGVGLDIFDRSLLE